MNSFFKQMIFLGTAILLFSDPSLAIAGQTLKNQPETPASLESITVTAQKKEENIQNVPISMTVFNEFDLEDNNIRTVSDITSYTPNFQQFSTGGGGMYTPSMRGLSSDVHTLSSPIGTYIDGIPYTSSMGNDVTLLDIQRVEILRGPQGTLYGKNAYAGVLNIITKKPDNETKGKIKAELGSDNKKEYTFSTSGPIVKDKFYMGVSGKHYEKDGYIKNEYLNKWDDDREDDSIKLFLRAAPADNLDISLISSYAEKDDGATTTIPLSSIDVRKTNSGLQGYTRSKSYTHALKVDYTQRNFDFSSTTTYKDYKDIRGTDYDYSPAQISHAFVDSRYKNYSQEFKLNGGMRKFNWIVGLYMEKDEQNPYYNRNGTITTNSDTQSDSLGIFAHTDYNLKENLILTAGLRYDKDNIETADGLSSYKNDKSYSEISPKIGLKYILNQNITSYASISKGYKAGGYYMMAPTNLRSYDKETMWNYEVGFKSRLLDNKLTLNMSVYYMDITDMQVAARIDDASAYMSNAATATNKGAEIEIGYKISNNLNIFTNLGYSEATFDKFEDYYGEYSGNYNPYAPKYNYALGFKYRDEKGIFAKFDISGQSNYYTNKANTIENNGFTLLNAKIGYEMEHYEIYLYCNNITDKEYDSEGYFDYYTMVSPPRETGISIAYRF